MQASTTLRDPRETGDDLVRAVAAIVVPRLADWCAIHLRSGAQVPLVGISCADPQDAPVAHEYASRFPATLDDPQGPGWVVRTGNTYVALEVTDEHVRAVTDDARARLVARIRPTSVVIAPLRTAEGVVGALTLCQSRSGRRFTEEDVSLAKDLAALASAAFDERRIRTLLAAQNEASPDGIFFQGADGRTAYYNENLLRIWGIDESVTAERTLEERFARIVDRLADPQAFFDLAREMELHQDRTVRVDVGAKDGRIMDCTTAPVRDTAGRFLGRVWYYREVTAQRRIERDLGQARREADEAERLALVGTLVSGVAHEVRTPLTYVANHSFLLRRTLERAVGEGALDAARAEQARGALDAIDDGTQRINRLVGQLRHLARRPEGRLVVDLNTAARGAVLLFQATHKEVVLEAAYAGTGSVLLEEGEVEQLVLNLLENAAEASPVRARVQVTTASAPGHVILTVRDWGSGIPPDVRRRMFEPFFTTKTAGLGLGLSIVQRICESAGGRVEVATEEGAGTVVTVTLPITVAAAEKPT